MLLLNHSDGNNLPEHWSQRLFPSNNFLTVEEVYELFSALVPQFYRDLNKPSCPAFDFETFVSCLIAECVFRIYNMDAPRMCLLDRAKKNPLELDQDSFQKYLSRGYECFRRYRIYDIEHYADYGLNLQYAKLPKLGKIMKGDKAFPRHSLTESNMMELENKRQIALINMIINGRIASSKKVSNKCFKEAMKEYDNMMQAYLDKLYQEEEPLLYANQLYVHEHKFNVDFYYALAVEAEKCGTRAIPSKAIELLTGRVGCSIDKPIPSCYFNDDLPVNEALPPRHIYTESRFLVGRMQLISHLFDSNGWKELYNKVEWYLFFKVYLFKIASIDGLSLIDYIRKHTTEQVRTSLLKDYYPMREIFCPKKEWTNFRIKYVRNLYKEFHYYRKM